MKSFFNDFDTCCLEVPQNITGTATSDPVDLDEYNGVTLLITLGVDAGLDAGDYWTFTLIECDTVGGSYTTVADNDVDDGSTSPSASIVVDHTDEDATCYKLSYTGNARFIKVVSTETSDTGDLDTPIAVLALLHRKRMGPPAQASVAIAS